MGDGRHGTVRHDLNDLVAADLDVGGRDRALGAFAESLPGAVFQLESRRHSVRYHYVSQRTQEVLGVTAASILTDPLVPASLVVPEDSATLFSGYADAARDMASFSVDVRIRRPDGAVRWVRTFATPGAAAEGILWHGYWNDVTDEVESRVQVEASEQRLKEITESLPGVVFRMVLEHGEARRYTDVSDGALAVYGVTRDEVLRDSSVLERGLEPGDLERIDAELAAAAHEQRQARIDFRFTRPDGQTRWLRSYSAPRRTEDGVAWVGYTDDVTAEREAQERAAAALSELVGARDAARTAEARLRAIFDHNRIGMVMIDEQRRFSEPSPSLRDLLETTDEQEFARDFAAFSPELQPDGRRSVDKALEVIDVAFAQGYNRFDWMHQTRAGVPRPCEIALTRVQLDGRPHLFATMTDLRERARHETELKAAWSQAQAASGAKSEFLANMSHEIRTPMNAIVGLAHLGRSVDDPQRLRDYIAKIDVAAGSLLQIVNDILDFSKIEAGRMTLETTPFELSGVLDDLCDMVSLRASEKGLELLIDLEPGLPPDLVGDPLRLRQVLLNLVGNAIKFTDRGQVVVRVTAAKRGSDFVRLRFEVADTGIGLTREQTGRLFVAFSQADTSTTRLYGGTGLGLVISQRLVDLMDGEITVVSRAGLGSTFAFTARFGLAPAAARRSPAPLSLRGMRVLVADDNPTAVTVLANHLESFGCSVTSASGGSQAIEAVLAGTAGQGFGLVLLDWQMPDMDGIEAARRIRELAGVPPPVIIMLTAFGREQVEHQAVAAGLDGVLVKPVNPSVLLDTILRTRGTGAVLATGGAPLRTPPGRELVGRRVLLVEDNELNQEVARELLLRAGVTVDLAVNGRDAVEQVAAADYDAVLMDVQMPVMDGLEATRRIRALPPPRARVPVIAMTANAMAEDRQRCLDAGMDDHVGKPVDADRLHAVLVHWTRHGSAAPPPATGTGTGTGTGRAGDPGDFDVDAAIRRLDGSRALWARTAQRYLESTPAHRLVAQHLQAGDRLTACREAHTVKGVAATLGLLALRDAASRLERLLQGPGAGVASALVELASAEETARRVVESAVGLPAGPGPRSGR